MATSPQEKGPAETAISPSHGSTNTPPNEMIMNTDSNTTAAAKAARDATVVSAILDLEADICSLLSMARILGDLLDADLTSFEEGVKVHMPKRGKPMKVYLSHDQMEMLSFARNDVINRAADLRRSYYEAIGGAA